ncbi:MAG: glycosyltransferase family 2 protein [Rhodothermales bacterium]|nr:glycosyltransferase family 2 protein [Rhodothermales bacterium]
MAAYNAAATIREAVASILWQSLSDWELIIAEDGSTDGTLGVIAGLSDNRIRVLSDGTNRGKPVRMNQIIDQAQAPYLAIMDADDFSYPTRLERQVSHLEANPHVDLLASGMATFDEGGHAGRWRRLRTEHADIVRHPWLGFHFNSPTWVGKTAWFQHHRYSEGLRVAEDEDLLLRASATSVLEALPELLMAYRIDQWTWSKARSMRRDHAKALARAAMRQRDLRPLAGVAVHGAKLLREGLAVATGREEVLLRKRALSLSGRETERLRTLYARLQREASQ